ncbi:MAG: alpha-L-arabinofuranosidase C-terminal domain-containing protein, partial [Clostridia bacterium]
QWLLANIDRYEKFPAKKPKVFLGEYAAKGNKLYNALAEAAYLTGMENSAHAVALTCYAPLLCHVDYKNWVPDLIYFDNHRICKTVNYYVQKLFANNLGDYILPVEEKNVGKSSPIVMPVMGGLEFVSDGVEGIVKDAQIINLDNGDAVNLGSFELGQDTRRPLSEINLPHCELRFKFTKTGGKNKGIIINFGKTDEKNRLCWHFGGWENQDCSIASVVDGMDSILDQHIFNVNTGYEYDMCLRIENRTITTIVDDIVINTCTDKIPEIKDLYITASKIRKSGEIIIKAVNINEKACKAEIKLGGEGWQGEMFTLAGDKDAENTLDKEAVSPVSEKLSCKGSLNMEFPPMSVRVIRVKPAM